MEKKKKNLKKEISFELITLSYQIFFKPYSLKEKKIKESEKEK